MKTPDVGAMHIRTALILVGITTVLAITNVCGWTHLSYWLVLAPGFYSWARPSLYRLISDATYHAHHRFDSDVEDDIEFHTGVRMNEAVALDAESMLRNLHLDDQAAGRA